MVLAAPMRCVDCGVPIVALRRDRLVCAACKKKRHRAAQRRWRKAHPEYMREAHRLYVRRHAVCRITVVECVCGRLWTRHGKNRGIYCRPCSKFYERMGNADRHRRRYWRLKALREAA